MEEVKRAGEEAGMCEGESIRYFEGLCSVVSKSKAEEIKNLQLAVIVNVDCD